MLERLPTTPAHPSPVLCLRCSDNYQLTLRTRQQFCVRGARNTTDFPCGHAAHLTAAARTPFLQPLTRGNTSGISPLGWPTSNNFSTCVQPQAPRPKAGPPLRTSQRSRLLRDNDEVADEHRARPFNPRYQKSPCLRSTSCGSPATSRGTETCLLPPDSHPRGTHSTLPPRTAVQPLQQIRFLYM